MYDQRRMEIVMGLAVAITAKPLRLTLETIPYGKFVQGVATAQAIGAHSNLGRPVAMSPILSVTPIRLQDHAS